MTQRILQSAVTSVASERELTVALHAAQDERRALLVEFTATWCMPCKQLHPELERYAAEAAPGIRTLSVDVDEHPGIAARYGVDRFPTMLLFAHGEPVLYTSEPRTVSRLHDVFDEVAARALAAPATGRYPFGDDGPVDGPVDEPAQDRRLILPPGERPGYTLWAYPRTVGRGSGMMLSAGGDHPSPWELTFFSAWSTAVTIDDAGLGEGEVDGLLAGLGDRDVDELALVLRDVPAELVAGLRRFETLRRLRVESPSLPGRDLADFAALSTLCRLDLNSMGSVLEPGPLRSLRAQLPGTIVNGTWTAAHLLVPPESEE